MSFGASPSDIIIVVTFCKTLYRKCRSAGGEYDEISREVRGLHTVLRHLKYEVEAPESPLNRDSSIWGRQLAPIIGDCDYTMRELDGLLMKYGRLSTSNAGGSSPTSPRILWERVKFGSNEMDKLGAIRVKLISHKTSLTLFLDTIQLHQSGKMASTLDNHGGQLDVILDKVDKIATKMQAKGGSVMTNYDDDDKEVWKQFRRELVAEGFSSDILQQHKDVLRAYIRQIDQEGLLEPVSTNSQLPPPPAGTHTERWLENVPLPALQTGSSTAVASTNGPPSFDSLNTPTDDGAAKEMVIREDNMKFPQSMKLQRPKPESRREGSHRELDIPHTAQLEDRSRSAPTAPSPVPLLVTSGEKEPYYLNTDGSSDEDSETDNSSRRSVSPSYGQIITTKNLMAMSQALMIRSQSPSSFRSQSSFIDDGVSRSTLNRPKKQLEYGTSPSRLEAIPIPSANGRTSSDRLGTTSRATLPPLAPDSQGNEIPPEAKWTKINRRLVSPEVLDQAHLRYEARPEFVAVLGILSRAEIQDLTARSHALREARRRKHFPPEVPPPQPPRPAPMAIPTQSSSQRPRGGRDTPSEDETDSCDSDHRHRRRREQIRPKGILKHNSSYTHQQPYSNVYGAPPSPVWSPASAERQPMWIPQQQDPRGAYYAPRERERDREPRKKHSSPHRRRDKDKPKEKAKEKPKSRWTENLTAASMGGAAVSLFHVLSEAAEGL